MTALRRRLREARENGSLAAIVVAEAAYCAAVRVFLDGLREMEVGE